MTVGLKRSDSNSRKVSTSFLFQILNSEEVYAYNKITTVFTDIFKSVKVQHISRPTNETIPFRLFNDRLIVKVCMHVRRCCLNNYKEVFPCSAEEKAAKAEQLRLDLQILTQTSEFSDVILIIGKEVIHAHKCILCARSPVFRKMFESSMKEKESNSVNITDIEKPILEAFLLYLYTGKLEVEIEDIDTVMSLFSVADKYEVRALHLRCCAILLRTIKPDTVTSILKLADTHSHALLKIRSVDYICKNFSAVESTADWIKLLDWTLNWHPLF